MLINIITDKFYNENKKDLEVRGDVIQLYTLIKYLYKKSKINFIVWQMGYADVEVQYKEIEIRIIKCDTINDFKNRMKEKCFENVHYNNIDCFSNNAKIASATIHTNTFLYKESAYNYLFSVMKYLKNIIVVNKNYFDVYKENNFILIRNSIDLKKFYFKKKKKSNNIDIFFPNLSHEENKNFKFASEVIELLNKTNDKRYKLYCCGEAEIKENIISLGYIKHSDMVYWYHKCLFSLIPSFSESCSLCFLESLSSGCYPLANNIIGLNEYAPNNKFLLSIKNPEVWKDKILYLLSNWNEYKNDIFMGHKWINDNFNNMINQYEIFWKSIFYE